MPRPVPGLLILLALCAAPEVAAAAADADPPTPCDATDPAPTTPLAGVLGGLIPDAMAARPEEERAAMQKAQQAQLQTVMAALQRNLSGAEKAQAMNQMARLYFDQAVMAYATGEAAGGSQMMERSTRLLASIREIYPDRASDPQILGMLWLAAMLEEQYGDAAALARILSAQATSPAEQALAALLSGEASRASGDTTSAVRTFQKAAKLSSPVAAVLAVRAAELKGSGPVKLARLPEPSGEAPSWLFDMDRLLRERSLRPERTQ